MPIIATSIACNSCTFLCWRDNKSCGGRGSKACKNLCW